MKPLSIVVLLSGAGSNLQAIINTQLNINIKAVISNRPQALGLTKAKAANIPGITLSNDLVDFDQQLLKILQTQAADYIILAGFMKILSPLIIQAYPRQILNIHPSLLPKHRGLNTYARALAAGDTHCGASIHLVSEELDAGPIIAQTPIAITSTDDVDSLKVKTQAAEHYLYPWVLQQLSVGRLMINEQTLSFDGQALPPQGLCIIEPKS